MGNDAILSLLSIILIAAFVAVLYFGRALLVPLALALLLTFMLSPVVARLERVAGRATAVFGLAIIIFTCLGAGGWVVTRQSLNLMASLPDYRTNIEAKIQGLELAKDSPVKRFSQMVVDVKSEIPSLTGPRPATPPLPTAKKRGAVTAEASAAAATAASAAAAEAEDPLGQMNWFLAPFLNAVGTVFVVMILVTFMLLKREDIRARFIKIVGHGRISTTSRAMEDAGERVYRFLTTQLFVNMGFGTAIALGLFLIGVPNAFLWGAATALLRFVPYVGIALAACGPMTLALAASPGWEMFFLTIGLFAVLELIIGSVAEPLLFRSSTGVSSLALILAAIFWAWIWGPVGLLLSTPLTVCLAVMGKHVSSLSFLGVLLGNEEALTPVEECYHRLLVGGMAEASPLVDSHIKANSLVLFYNDVLIPTVTMTELDFARRELEDEQRGRVVEGVREIIEDLSSLPPDDERLLKSSGVVLPSGIKTDLRIGCLAARAERDEIVASILVHLLQIHGLTAEMPERGTPTSKLPAWVEEENLDVVCIATVLPSTVAQARQLCARLRERCPNLRIIVGLWGEFEGADVAIRLLQSSGAHAVSLTLSDAVGRITEYSQAVLGDMVPAEIPTDENDRIIALNGVAAYGEKGNPIFDRMTHDLTRTFDVPIALLTLIDSDRQHFKSQFGLPIDMAEICDIPRDSSICGHVVYSNSLMVVEDLAADRRFANNPILKANKLRFYAGVPLRSRSGQPIGALCILDTKPRHFTEADRRVLLIMGEVMSDEIASHPALTATGPERVPAGDDRASA